MGAELEAFAPSVHLTLSASPSLAARRGPGAGVGKWEACGHCKAWSVSGSEVAALSWAGVGRGLGRVEGNRGCRWTTWLVRALRTGCWGDFLVSGFSGSTQSIPGVQQRSGF